MVSSRIVMACPRSVTARSRMTTAPARSLNLSGLDGATVHVDALTRDARVLDAEPHRLGDLIHGDQATDGLLVGEDATSLVGAATRTVGNGGDCAVRHWRVHIGRTHGVHGDPGAGELG